ncbi:hypothetical protein BDY17DRAFT_293278 [Neohortaea acidophila]|uniref:Uncharacterized protein n=1 Tax=Neohortaea acidophila TaxID=245834 RepID=A0A6A6PYU1_9PEZI|nr:uncharacterized protein BDY17DRAFT_293278 [Neohortaea acidophila]KAF2485300.1 hypothetical protein BDY17DRAFT_293278 [Neohortaea acidophila]
MSSQLSTDPLIPATHADATSAPQKEGAAAEDKGGKGAGGKRRFFGLGKKKDGDKAGDMATTTTPPPPTAAAPSSAAQTTPSPAPRTTTTSTLQPLPSPSRTNPYPAGIAVSPSRLRSASPARRHSPASSEIFERNVQDPAEIAQLHGELDPAHIPSHVITEDRIPPALEASAQAITQELNPDEVEIVTSASHQPAAAAVLDPSASQADLASHFGAAGGGPLSAVTSHDSGDMPGQSSIHHSGILPAAPLLSHEEDGASTYGQLDPTDVRRLSFISFADVVQSEHQHQAGDPATAAGGSTFPHLAAATSHGSRPRAGSPLASSPPLNASVPASAVSGLATPPALGSPSAGGGAGGGYHEHSPSPPTHGELTIETLRQAVRKTASGDLSGHAGAGTRSAGMSSPVSEEPLSGAGVGSAPRSRTNS